MEQKFMIRTENSISGPMDRAKAIQKVKEFENQGIDAYIVSQDEGERLEENGNQFNTPKWS